MALQVVASAPNETGRPPTTGLPVPANGGSGAAQGSKPGTNLIGIQRGTGNKMLTPSEQVKRDANKVPEDLQTGLISHVRSRWNDMRNHRESTALETRLLNALRTFTGEYSPTQLAAIKQMGGSEVFARIVAGKCRGATALLRDIYNAAERPWDIDPTDEPTLPEGVDELIPKMVSIEVQQLQQQGQPVNEDIVKARIEELTSIIRQAQREKSKEEAEKAATKMNDILQEGGFYTALAELLIDIPLFPYAVIKGPFVRMVEKVKYIKGKPTQVRQPQLQWERCSPFEVYWTPGVAKIEEGEVIHKLRWTRKSLNDLIGLPGWDEVAVREAIKAYDGGLRDWMSSSDSPRAVYENREDPSYNTSDIIDAAEYHGSCKGSYLLDMGFTPEQVPDEDLEYSIQTWVVGRFVLKVQLNPNPRNRHIFYLTSYEKVPGTPVGHAIPDMIEDVSDVANAALRSLVNNMSFSSGPQVVVMADRVSVDEDPTQMYPWKRWLMDSDPYGNNTSDPIKFFQPKSNASELLGIYKAMSEMADEHSAIPRYITGSGASGGAGRTASGLSMLMNNASKVLQQVAFNIDNDILRENLEALYDMVMVADAGVELKGDEKVVVKGVTRVIAKETERVRQLEFISLTGNPMDMQIIGMEGRAALLRAVSKDLNLPDGDIVPPKAEIQARQKQALEASQQQTAANTPPEKGGGGEGPAEGPVAAGPNAGPANGNPPQVSGEQQTNNVSPNFNKRGS